MRPADPTLSRRAWLHGAAAVTFGAALARNAEATTLAGELPPDDTIALRLRAGGVVLAFRHATAPGTFDPPGFRLDDCKTQRNLDDSGRAEAARIGEWFKARALVPARVRSSPWCRCLDTARGAFGQADSWDALASPSQADGGQRAQRLAALRAALRAVPAGRFEAWVTHQFVLQDLAGVSTASAEALLLRAGPGAAPVEVLARAVLF